MNKFLIHPAYFPSIVNFSIMINANELMFEIMDFFEKQTYRNRMYIQTANGKQMLSVPVEHTHTNTKQIYKDVKISYDFDWKKLHWRTLETAYRTSPYFEFYEDDLYSLFLLKEKYLYDFNIKIFQKLMELLEIERTYVFTTSYMDKNIDFIDVRHLKNAKKNLPLHNKLFSYTQMFNDRMEFIPNLSILDLLFMEGTNTMDYLDKVFKIYINENSK